MSRTSGRWAGSKNLLPTTFLTFLVGTLALTGCPGLSGFFSKDSIISAALESGHPMIFALALATAFLTSFYMFRLMVVVFWGHTRSKHAQRRPRASIGDDHPADDPCGSRRSLPATTSSPEDFCRCPRNTSILGVMGLSVFVFVTGAGLAWFVYNGKDSDPIVIPLLANRFYLDQIYQTLIACTQDLAASLGATFDRWILDGAIVRGLSGAAWVTGFVLRFLQLGNLQAYAFLFGAGSVALIYYFLFSKP